MNESLYDKLTDKEKEALRLVADNKQSKEIGIELGITHHAVKQRIKTAMRKLEVQNRHDAARILLMEEKPEQFRDPLPSQQLIYPPGDIEIHASAQDGGNVIDEMGRPIIREHGRAAAPDEIWILALFKLSRENNLSTTSRIIVMIMIAFGSIFIVGMMMVIAESLSSFFAG